MRSEFMIERHGKQFVLYSGLLDEAHALGLKSIETDILEKPNDMNGRTAIVHARVTMDGERFFDGIGDASPDNVSRNIVPHLIRQAETRAKARALRDAINVGVMSFEESDGGEVEAAPDSGNVTPMRNAQQRTKRAAKQPKQPDEQGKRRSDTTVSESFPATRKQLNYLESLLEDNDHIRERLEQKYGKTVAKLTREEASAAIAAMTGQRSG